MAGKKSITFGGFMILLVISIWVGGFATPAIAETVNFKLYDYQGKQERALIGDVENHVFVQQIRRGFFVLENGEIAQWLVHSQNEQIKGSGSFKNYGTITFSDGSTIMTKGQGTIGGTVKSTRSAGTKSEIIKGTGRFEGIKGTMTYTGKFLPLDKGEEGQKAIREGTLNYTLPSK